MTAAAKKTSKPKLASVEKIEEGKDSGLMAPHKVVLSYDKKFEAEIISYVTNKNMITFASALRNTLSVMSSLNHFYFTCYDIAHKMRDDNLKPYPQYCTPKAMEILAGRIAAEMSTLYKKSDHSHNAIYRTSSRIQHHDKNVKARTSYGYRVGRIVGEVLNGDTIREGKESEAAFAKAFGESDIESAIVKAIKGLDYQQLYSVQRAVMQQMQFLFKKLSDKATELGAERLAQMRAELEKLEKTVARI